MGNGSSLIVIFGTRPESQKLFPVVQGLWDAGVPVTVWATGQHTDLLKDTPLRPDVNFAWAPKADPLAYAAQLIDNLHTHKPPVSAVMVQGDTASAYAGAMVAQKWGLPVIHLEAGVRSHDLKNPWPEEEFRVQIDRVAELRLCATEDNKLNLINELRLRAICVTGNSGIDALYAQTRPTSARAARVIVTLHRRESFGEALQFIVEGLCTVARIHPELEFVWPVHPNPAVRAALPDDPPDNLLLIPPLPPLAFQRMLSRSRAVLTDSGGVQEEAAALGIPCVVAREVTDRPESVDAGIAVVAGRTAAGVTRGMRWALTDAVPAPSYCFGDGHATPRIVEAIQQWLR